MDADNLSVTIYYIILYINEYESSFYLFLNNYI